MMPIHQSLQSFTEHLEQNISISCSNTGWKADSFIQKIKNKIYQWLCCNKDGRLESIGKCFTAAMDQLERTPVQFNLETAIGRGGQTQYYTDYLKAAKLVKKLLRTANSPKICKQLNALAQRVSALKYRIEACNGGMDQSNTIDEVLHENVKAAALEWKEGQKLFIDRSLSERDLKKIRETCSYPKFAKLLLNDSTLKQNFFKWVLRDNNGVSQFVQFPSICQRLKTSYVASRLGRFGGEVLSIDKIVKQGTPLSTTEKVLQLPFYNGIKAEQVSILDELREITLNAGWKLSIKKIFDVFANKNNEEGNIEYVGANGIMNWNTHKLGAWNPATKTFSQIDFNDPLWIKQLPLSEVKSQEEIDKNYGVALSSGEWLFVYRATRETPDLSIGGRHGFLEVVMPMEEGKYAIYPFGKYADRFPIGKLALLAFLNTTAHAAIVYPDDNIYYPHRQHAMASRKISSEEGLHFLDSIRQDLLKVQSKNKVFQLRRENCAHWVHETSERVESCKALNPFKIEATQSGGFAFIAKLPKSWQSKFVGAIDVLFGAHRGLTVVEDGKKVFKSVSVIPSHEKMFVYQPGWLHKQIESGALSGRIYAGH